MLQPHFQHVQIVTSKSKVGCIKEQQIIRLITVEKFTNETDFTHSDLVL